MFMRRIGLVAASLLAALSLTACSTDAIQSDSDAASSTTKVQASTALTQHIRISNLDIDLPADWTSDGTYATQTMDCYVAKNISAVIVVKTNLTYIDETTPISDERQVLDALGNSDYYSLVGDWQKVESGNAADAYQAETHKDGDYGYLRVLFSGNQSCFVQLQADSTDFFSYQELFNSIMNSVTIRNATAPDFAQNAGLIETEQAGDGNAEESTGAPVYSAGSYRVGIDLPAGGYKLNCTSSHAYFCVYPDTTKSEILMNDNFTTCDYVYVTEGQLLEVEHATFISSSEATPTTTWTGSGTYKVGFDIPAGEYNLIATGERGGYYAILDTVDANVEFNIVSNDNFEGNSYVYVEDGQYLVLSRASVEQ